MKKEEKKIFHELVWILTKSFTNFSIKNDD